MKTHTRHSRLRVHEVNAATTGTLGLATADGRGGLKE